MARKTGNAWYTERRHLTRPRRGLRAVEAASYIGVSIHVFTGLVKAGLMPRPKKIPGCRPIWDMYALEPICDIDALDPYGPGDDDAQPIIDTLVGLGMAMPTIMLIPPEKIAALGRRLRAGEFVDPRARPIPTLRGAPAAMLDVERFCTALLQLTAWHNRPVMHHRVLFNGSCAHPQWIVAVNEDDRPGAKSRMVSGPHHSEAEADAKCAELEVALRTGGLS